MDIDPGDRGTRPLDLTGMDADAHLQPERADAVADGERTAHLACGAREHRQKAVAGRVDLGPTVTVDWDTNDPIVLGEELFPRLVAEAFGGLRRIDDVGKQQRR